MHGFDSLTLKNFLNINYDFLKNASVQKVQQPSRREIILNLRNSGVNKKLYVNINPKYPHICFLNETSYALRSLVIPKSPPMFCMQLRKYIEGSRIKEITIPDYERILELHFEVWDEVGQLANLCLSVEIMGKYSNVILYDSRSKNILGSAHNVSAQKSSVREVYGGIPYIYPPKQIKTDILKTSFGAFCEVIKNSENLTKAISSHYYYLSEPIVSSILEVSKSEDDIFSNLQKTVSLFDQKFLNDFWGGMEFNSALDNYFAQIIFKDILNLRKTFLSRILKDEIKKLNSLLKNPPSDEKAFKYKMVKMSSKTNTQAQKFLLMSI